LFQRKTRKRVLAVAYHSPDNPNRALDWEGRSSAPKFTERTMVLTRIFAQVSHDRNRHMNEFLQPTTVIDSTCPNIVAAAAEIVGNATEDEEIARRCFMWVRDCVRHSSDHRIQIVTCTASEVLKHRVGFCYAKSHLLAALIRARGIPAALCYQRLAVDSAGSAFCLHGLTAVLLQRHGWYRVDPRGDKPGVATDFRPPVEQLAFTPKLPGEADLPGRFADTLPCVVAALRQWSTADQLALNLPDYAHIA
jgi:transglutaminase-like putative cysteine protease